MSIKPVQNQFNGGELSPYMDGRFDLPVYQYSSAIMLNYIPMSEGCFKRRGGTHFVASAKQVEAFIFTINPFPADAKVIINGIQQNTCYCAYGDEISYTVMADNYQTRDGKITIYENTSLDVTLVSNINFYDFTLNVQPEGASVIINGVARNTINSGENSKINWTASLNNYVTQSGSLILHTDTVLDIALKMRFEIRAYPADATIIINGEERSYIDVDEGDEVSWSVSRAGLETQSGTEQVTTTIIKSINLSSYEQGQVLFEQNTAGSTTLSISEAIDANIYVIAGGGGGCGWAGRSVGGGSGSGFIGRIVIPAGTYSINVGGGGYGCAVDRDGSTLTAGTGGSSNIGNLVVAYGGTGGRVGRDHFDGGIGGGAPSVAAELIISSLQVGGNNGSRIPSSAATGGTSLYGGYGSGGNVNGASGQYGSSGYVKIVYMGVA